MTIVSTLPERLLNTASAAHFLERHIKDGRNYVHVLNDQRRGRRNFCIPFTRRGLQVYYRMTDLLVFIDAERKRGVISRPAVLVVEDELMGLEEFLNLEDTLKTLMALRDAANDEIEKILAVLEVEKEAA
jgi:hypothetical protein